MLSNEEVERIAKLARIKLTDQEKDKFKKELSLILDYVKTLEAADTSNVAPLYQTTGLINAEREDGPGKEFQINEKLDELLIGQAPNKQGRFIKVKSILKK
jgi:aspartyl-tRNA(Asn)/glutamyl-tRNA(Gln) amidotransferase subunit C